VPGRTTTPAWLDKREERTNAAKERVTTVKRYWPGQAPAEEEEAAVEPVAAAPSRLRHEQLRPPPAQPSERVIRAPEVVARKEKATAATPVDEEELDDAEIDRRRAAARARALQLREAEVPEWQAEEEEQEQDEEESETEWETDTEDEAEQRKLLRPVFVPKAERESLAEREAQRRAEEEEAAREAARKATRRAESREVAEALIERGAALEAVEAQAEPSDVDTDDEAAAAGEYEAWQARELGRLRRDREAREASAAEREEAQRLRSMTVAERAAWEAEHPPEVDAARREKEKRKWVFMQKYYHKGAFFQAEADDRFGTVGTFDIYKRDFGEATGDDKGMDRSLLPKPMQVKKGMFGRAGQTKWTHLADADTTAKRGDDLWAAAGRGRPPRL